MAYDRSSVEYGKQSMRGSRHIKIAHVVVIAIYAACIRCGILNFSVLHRVSYPWSLEW
jgi:hypothetical protein